jgi:hypothetical protein
MLACWTMPWVSTRAGAGRKTDMMELRRIPPPIPMMTVRIEEKNETTMSVRVPATAEFAGHLKTELVG